MNSYTLPAVTMPYGEQPAFPCDTPVEKYASGERKRDAAGLTVRDYFAAQAVAGFLAMCADPECSRPKPDDVATYCYRVADAMLAARAPKEG
jgi:hypothetical protein